MAKKPRPKTNVRNTIAYWKKKLRLNTQRPKAPYALKAEAHQLLEQVFGDYKDLTIRAQMYAYLNDYTSTGHISTMTEVELKALIGRLKKML